MPLPVALIGYRATGKTSIGRRLARELGRPFFDTDAIISERAEKTIAEIFAQQGETAFRELESQVIDEFTKREGIVLSLGGGAIVRPENRSWIGERCDPIVWLEASVEAIFRRLNADTKTGSQRPNLTEQGGIREIREVLEARTPLYAGLATLRIDTEKDSTPQVTRKIIDSIRVS